MRSRFLLSLVFLCTALLSAAQVKDLRYVDFHIHTSMKNYYRTVPHPDSLLSARFIADKDTTLWNWYGTMHRKKFRRGRKFSGFYGKDSRPEASWDLIAGMNPRPWVLCTSITPIEKRFVSEKPIPVLFLKLSSRTINRAMVTKLDCKRQKSIYEGTSFGELRGELEYMKLQPVNPKTGKQDVLLVNDSADLANAIANGQTGLVLTIEGAHAFMDTSTIHKEFEPKFGIDSANAVEIFNNIDTIKAMSPHVFFVTLSHMSWNGMCGHAKSLDMNKGWLRLLLGHQSEDKRFRNVTTKRFATTIDGPAKRFARPDEAFAVNPCKCEDPAIDSFKLYGMDVLKRLLDNTNGQRRVLIDTRHLAVEGRKQYIDSVLEWRKKGDMIPIIVSHAAASGKTYKQAQFYGFCPFADRYLEVRKTKRFYNLYNSCLQEEDRVDIKKTGWFHPFSINLYDEEIAAVAETDGIIGITLEERVLGTGRHNYNRQHYRQLKKAFKRWPNADKYTYTELKKLEPFMRNLLYIVSVLDSSKPGLGWNYVALGSDFDGMVDPLDVCAEPGDLPKFYQMLELYLPLYANDFLKESSLVTRENVQNSLNKLFYKNGETFIRSHFK